MVDPLPLIRRAATAVLASVLLGSGVGAVAGCGSSGAAADGGGTAGPSIGAGSGSGTVSAPGGAAVTRSPARTAPRPAGLGSAPRAVAARVDASSDAALAEGKGTVAPGAPSDAQVRRELQQARDAGVVLPAGDTAASFARSSSGPQVSVAAALAAGAEIPQAVWNPYRKAIADWIVPVLQWAYLRGWRGAVTSGYRSYQEQAALNAAGLFSAPAGASNHETTAYPGGAVDVTNPSQLLSVLASYPGPQKLIGGRLGPVDPEHFSATGD